MRVTVDGHKWIEFEMNGAREVVIEAATAAFRHMLQVGPKRENMRTEHWAELRLSVDLNEAGR